VDLRRASHGEASFTVAESRFGGNQKLASSGEQLEARLGGWCLTTLWTRWCAQFIVCLSGNLQFWIGTLAVGEEEGYWRTRLVATPVATSPAITG
jgi:hypothetical protein